MTNEMKKVLEEQTQALEAYDALVKKYIEGHQERCGRVSPLEVGPLQTLLGMLGVIHSSMATVRSYLAALPQDLLAHEPAATTNLDS